MTDVFHQQSAFMSGMSVFFHRLSDFKRKKNLIAKIILIIVLFIRKKFVILHPVWNKYQKRKLKT